MSTHIRSTDVAAETAAASPSITNKQPRGIYTAHVCSSNADLIAEAARLYAPPSSKIADVTFGKGVFWRKLDLSKYDMHASDVVTLPERPYNFRDLPYDNTSFDIVVLDPPYRHHGGAWTSANYQNEVTTKKMDHAAIIENYEAGMREALRILKFGGTLWVKTQDEVQGGKQHLSTVEIHNAALALGFVVRDQFILVQRNDPKIQALPQRSAKKNHSTLWVFAKLRPAQVRQKKRTAVSKCKVSKTTPFPNPTITATCVAQTL